MSECWDCIALFEDYYPTEHPKTFLYGCMMILGDDCNGVNTEELYSKCPVKERRINEKEREEKL